MRNLYLLLITVFTVFSSCKKEIDVSSGNNSREKESLLKDQVLLKDIVIATLPAPYYHFEYDSTSKASFVSFASDFTRYNIVYRNKKIDELRNNILVNKDRLHYVYDSLGRVTLVRYLDATGAVFTKVKLAYNGQKLIKLSRLRKSGTDFVVDKTMKFSYQPDGNLSVIDYHYPPFGAQTETSFRDKFENYDNKRNVDGFSLVHNDFFDHLVFLPDVQFQVNNPTKETRSGDGTNYVVNYTYTYNDKNLPLTKKGKLTITSTGSDQGNVISTSTTYSYY